MLNKPNRKRDKQRRKRKEKKKDAEIQQWAANQPCEACGKVTRDWQTGEGQNVGHHIVGRRHKSLRHDKSNIMPLCHNCHTFIHDKGEQAFYYRYPHLND